MRTDDGYIIQQCLDGKASAFGLLVDKYKKSIYALAYSEVRNFHDAQDITQEAFIKAYRNLHTLKRWDSFMGWLYRITMNICKNRVRSESRRSDTDFIEDQDLAKIDDPSIESYRQESIYESVRDSIESLPEVYRQVLTLRYFGGMSIKEMCNLLSVSHATIERRLREAQGRLREEILAMIKTDNKGYDLPSAFTFNIVEMIKSIRINPMSPTKAVPWGLSIAIGLVAGFLSIGTHFNLFEETISIFTNSASKPKVLDVGEYSVDVLDIAKIPDMSMGLGPVVPNLQNALFMAPQAGDTWTKKTDMPTARFLLSTSVVNGKIYTIGGYDRNNPFPTVEEYDPVTNTWTKKADMPTARFKLSTSVINGKIYAIGGRGFGGCSSAVEEYDPVSNTWTKKANMPNVRDELSTDVVNGKIYAIGGAGINGLAVSTVEEYDPVSDTWTKKADMPTARCGFSSSVVDGKIYAISGICINGIVSTVEEYDPVADKWRGNRANIPTERYLLSASVVNGKIYAIGGYYLRDALPAPLSALEEYNPNANQWTKKADMPTARWGLSTSVVNGKIYAIGGYNFRTLSTVEEYDTGTSDQSINLKGKLQTTWGETKTALNR